MPLNIGQCQRPSFTGGGLQPPTLLWPATVPSFATVLPVAGCRPRARRNAIRSARCTTHQMWQPGCLGTPRSESPESIVEPVRLEMSL